MEYPPSTGVHPAQLCLVGETAHSCVTNELALYSFRERRTRRGRDKGGAVGCHRECWGKEGGCGEAKQPGHRQGRGRRRGRGRPFRGRRWARRRSACGPSTVSVQVRRWRPASGSAVAPCRRPLGGHKTLPPPRELRGRTQRRRLPRRRTPIGWSPRRSAAARQRVVSGGGLAGSSPPQAPNQACVRGRSDTRGVECGGHHPTGSLAVALGP